MLFYNLRGAFDNILTIYLTICLTIVYLNMLKNNSIKCIILTVNFAILYVNKIINPIKKKNGF